MEHIFSRQMALTNKSRRDFLFFASSDLLGSALVALWHTVRVSARTVCLIEHFHDVLEDFVKMKIFSSDRPGGLFPHSSWFSFIILLLYLNWPHVNSVLEIVLLNYLLNTFFNLHIKCFPWAGAAQLFSDNGSGSQAASLTGAEDFSSSLCVQTGSGAHPASCPWLKRNRGVTLATDTI
jgi:hypothetical protein